MGRGHPTSRTPSYITGLEVLLEAKNDKIAELEKILLNPLGSIEPIRKENAELKTKLKNTEWHLANEANLHAEAAVKLDAVRELPDDWHKWAAKAKSQDAKRAAECVTQCANELQAALNGEES